MIVKTLRIKNLFLTKLETNKSEKKAYLDTHTLFNNENLDNKRKQKYLDSSERSDGNQLETKKKCKSCDEITGEFKKIKPPCVKW
jgi:hypothetical protein